MKLTRFAALAVLLCLGTAYAQDVEKKIELKIVVAGDGASDFTWTGDGEDLSDLAIGETRTLSSDSGQDATVTKTESGLEFNVNGETVVMPDIGAHGTHMAFVGADSVHEPGGDVEVEVMSLDGEHETVDVKVIGGGAHAVRAHPMDGITIISGEPLDASVRESIRSVLISAGHDDEVRFVDGSGDGQQVRVIEKRVEIEQ